MCGRFIFIPNEEEEQFFDSFSIKESIDLTDSYNVAPTQSTPVVTRNSPNKATYMHWGLIPSWSKDTKFASKMINARIETLSEKPAFRGLVNKNRCLIPANGYYEWGIVEEEKHPFLISKRDGNFLAMGGLYDKWESPAGEIISSFTIITQPAGESIDHIHNRMPYIINQSSWEIWLNSDRDFKSVQDEISLTSSEDLQNYQVSKKVNSPTNNSRELIVRV